MGEGRLREGEEGHEETKEKGVREQAPKENKLQESKGRWETILSKAIVLLPDPLAKTE